MYFHKCFLEKKKFVKKITQFSNDLEKYQK